MKKFNRHRLCLITCYYIFRKYSPDGDPLHAGRATNRAGGAEGGITTGLPVVARLAFKPTPSIPREQTTVDLATNEPAPIRVPGRHDPCVVPRAVPLVESAAAFALLDLLLSDRAHRFPAP